MGGYLEDDDEEEMRADQRLKLLSLGKKLARVPKTNSNIKMKKRQLSIDVIDYNENEESDEQLDVYQYDEALDQVLSENLHSQMIKTNSTFGNKNGVIDGESRRTYMKYVGRENTEITPSN